MTGSGSHINSPPYIDHENRLAALEGNTGAYAPDTWYDTLADIRAVTVHADGDRIGYFPTETVYVYSDAATATDDGANYIKPTDVSGAGRWVSDKRFAIVGHTHSQYTEKVTGAVNNNLATWQDGSPKDSGVAAANLVLKDGAKQLSTEDYTTEEKAKLASLPADFTEAFDGKADKMTVATAGDIGNMVVMDEEGNPQPYPQKPGVMEDAIEDHETRIGNLETDATATAQALEDLEEGKQNSLGTPQYNGQIPSFDTEGNVTWINQAEGGTGNTLTLEPTGFTDPENIDVSYDPVTRKITLTGNVEAYWIGSQVESLTDGWVSEAHPDTAERYFLYYNGSSFVWSTTQWTFSMLHIAIAFYEGSSVGWGLRECHGLMPHTAHEELHDIFGTYIKSGGGADAGSYALDSTTAADRRPLWNAVSIKDEDLPTDISALLSETYTRIRLETGLAYTFVTGSSDIINLSGNQPYFNQISGGNGSQVLMSANNYQKIFLVALPVTSDSYSQQRRFAVWQGQMQSTSLSAIQAITFRSIQKGTFGSLVTEFAPVLEIIIQYTAGNWKLISLNTVNESRGSTSIIGQTGITSVATDSTLTGNGTAESPLSVVSSGGVGEGFVIAMSLALG